MVTVEEAEKLILEHARDFGTERIGFKEATGRVLAENILSDRDIPPFNRVTMDGIAIQFDAFSNGIKSFKIIHTQAAGQEPVTSARDNECSEIMTGASLPLCFDTVIPYEHLIIENGIARVCENNVQKGQNIHFKGTDKKSQDIILVSGNTVTPSGIGVLASVGKTEVLVKKLPKIVIVSTGDEVIEVHKSPNQFQIRRSNNYTLKAVLEQYHIEPEMMHLPDDPKTTFEQLHLCLRNFDVIILTGGVSMGKFDYVPQSLKDLSVQPVFYKVQQKPGKPFWLGSYQEKKMVFAFPGNPVSTFLCMHRYFLPWLHASLRTTYEHKAFAILNEDVMFKPDLQYFLQVKLSINEKGTLNATPVAGNGSGDFSNLLNADAFMELPKEKDEFKKGDSYPIWPFNPFL